MRTKTGRGIVNLAIGLLLLLAVVLLAAGGETAVRPVVAGDASPKPGGDAPVPGAEPVARLRTQDVPGRQTFTPDKTADTMTFDATADSDIVQNLPGYVGGADSTLWAGYDDWDQSNGGIWRGLVQFDISALPDGAQISSAQLWMAYIGSFEKIPGINSRTVTAYRISGSWTEMGVIWSNQPGFAESYGSQNLTHGDFSWVSFDVTALVAAWEAGTYANYGIMLRGPESPSTGFREFGTKESLADPDIGADYLPYLVVEYSVPAPTDTPTPEPPTETPTQTPTPEQPTDTPTPEPPTDTPTPAPPTNTPLPSPTPECFQWIVNSGFENRDGWTLPTTPFKAGYSNAQVHQGSWAMRTGIPPGYGNVYSYSSAIQTVTIPAGADPVYLRFYLYPESSEPSYLSLPKNPLDVMGTQEANSGDAQFVMILNQYGTEIARLINMRSNAQMWQEYEFDLSAYAGRTIKIYFDTYNNGWGGVTSMHVDDVVLTSCQEPPPGPTPTYTPEPPTPTPTATPTPGPLDNLFFLPVNFADYPVGISGQVTDGLGLGLGDVTIKTDKGQQTVTDSRGFYSFIGLPDGEYILTPEKTSYTFAPLDRTVTIPPSAGMQNFVGTLPSYP